VLYHPYDPATCKNPSVLVGLDSLGRFLSVLRVGADLGKGKGAGQGTCPQALRKTSTLVDCRVDAERHNVCVSGWLK
jgi:hypothetical protein